MTCAQIAENSSLLAVGFSDSIIKVWTLVPQKLRSMKSSEKLQDIDREAGMVKLLFFINKYIFELIYGILVNFDLLFGTFGLSK